MAKISLCIIAGREADHIIRCLSSFADAFDELCLVEAIGNQEPDATMTLAREWCVVNGKEYRFSQYRNAAGNDWPHIDDFAAARNMSFNIASGDWLFWADCDDLASHAGAIRSAINDCTDDVLFFPYDVPGTNKCPKRERAVRRKLWAEGLRWRNAVHENIQVLPEHSQQKREWPRWIHAPLGSKPRSHERNLRILGAALQDTPSALFYAHSEHVYAGSNEKAREIGLAALAMPNLPDTFRFETMMNMGRTADKNKEAVEWFAKAYAFAPQLREPLAGLALTYLSMGDHRRALQACEAMLRTPEPAPEDRFWTHEAKWYRWAAHDLYDRLLRLNGICPPRRRVKISLLHATRGRTQAAWKCRERWLNTAKNPADIEHVVAVDADDLQSVEFARQFIHVVVPHGGGCVAAWNAAAHVSSGQILVQLSDDWFPSYGWDTAILDAIGDTSKPAVLAVSDGARTDNLLCMAILTRARWEQQGREVFSGEYKSMYSDNEFTHRAYRDGIVIEKRTEIVFEHLHPAFGKGVMDATYAASNAPERHAEGLATFLRRNPDAQLAQ